MRYVRLYALAVYRSWVAFLSGIVSIALMLVGTVTPVPNWLILFATFLCVIVAMFTAWLNEFLGREKAEAQLADVEKKRQRQLRVAALAHQGKQLLATWEYVGGRDFDRFQRAVSEWEASVMEFVSANCPYPTHRTDLGDIMTEDWPQMIARNLDLLKSVGRAAD